MPAPMMDAVTCQEPIGHWLSSAAAVWPPSAFQLSKNISLSRCPIPPYQQSVESGGDECIKKRMKAALLIYLKGSLKQEDLCWLQHFLRFRPKRKELTAETDPNDISSRPLRVHFIQRRPLKAFQKSWKRCWSALHIYQFDGSPSLLKF